MQSCPYLTLNNGNKIPQFGLGTYEILPNEKCTEACLEAMKLGYRHFDTAHFYGNEKGVADAVVKSGLKREDIFVTSKIWPTEFDHAEQALSDMFKRTNLSYIDLVLLHWPFGDYISAWKALEKFAKEGKIKNLGLSNFYGKQLQDILDICTIKPVCDQVECHPYKNRLEFKKTLEKEKIVLVAWSPIRNIDDALKQNQGLIKMKDKYKKSFVQLILRWHIQNGNVVIPKSANAEHMKSNSDVFDFELTKEEMDILNNIPQKKDEDPKDTEKFCFANPPPEKKNK